MTYTLILIIVTCIISFIAFGNQQLFDKLKHYPYIEARQKEYYRMLSSGFLHGSILHLFINMFVLYSFGEYVETVFAFEFGAAKGPLLFLFLYLLMIVLADIPTFAKHKNNPHFASIGASGAVSGVLFIFILFDPWALLYFYGIIPIPGIIAGVGFLIYSSWASKNSKDLIDHDAHFYGAIVGFLGTVLLKPELFSQFLQKLVNVQF